MTDSEMDCYVCGKQFDTYRDMKEAYCYGCHKRICYDCTSQVVMPEEPHAPLDHKDLDGQQ